MKHRGFFCSLSLLCLFLTVPGLLRAESILSGNLFEAASGSPGVFDLAARRDDREARKAPAATSAPSGRKAKASKEAPAGKPAKADGEAGPAAAGGKAAVASAAKPFRLTVKGAVLMDMATGEVIFEQDADQPIAPASLTKVLTLFLVFEDIAQGRVAPWDQVTVSETACAAGGSNMRLHSGEKVGVTELIKGVAVASANDACVALAEHLERGDVAAFVRRMNDQAQALGMSRSVFFNPNGMPAEGQQTTARDMLKLANAYLERYPKSLSIHSMQYFEHNGRIRRNANSLLGRYEGADGLKTGFVNASGYNIVVTAKRGETRLLAAVLGARSPAARERETVKLLDEGFKIVTAKKSGDPTVLAFRREAASGQ